MVVLNKIYTKTGDAGETALGNGARVAKHSMRVTAYGTVDELNAFVGVARLEAAGDLDAGLARIQNDLFDLGADLCRPDMEKDAEAEYPPLRMTAWRRSERLETEIDAMNEASGTVASSFILPGGSASIGPSAPLPHGCQTCRTTDGGTCDDGDREFEAAVKYLNRLSDWFFVAARVANDDGRADVLWVPGANR